MSLLLARNGHGVCGARCLLCGVEQTLRLRRSRSEFDIGAALTAASEYDRFEKVNPRQARTMETSAIDIPQVVTDKWQEITNLLAELVQVPAALVMRIEPPEISVFVASKSQGNPYQPRERACLNTGLYCETVMRTRQFLLVPDARDDDEWRSNPDIKLGMISYLGLPISWT